MLLTFTMKLKTRRGTHCLAFPLLKLIVWLILHVCAASSTWQLGELRVWACVSATYCFCLSSHALPTISSDLSDSKARDDYDSPESSRMNELNVHILLCIVRRPFLFGFTPNTHNIFPTEHPYLGPEHGAVQLTGALLISQLKLQCSQGSWGKIAHRGTEEKPNYHNS